jgi:hypothetical protein
MDRTVYTGYRLVTSNFDTYADNLLFSVGLCHRDAVCLLRGMNWYLFVTWISCFNKARTMAQALVPRLLPRRPGFDPRSVVGRVAIERGCFPVLRFFSFGIFPLFLLPERQTALKPGNVLSSGNRKALDRTAPFTLWCFTGLRRKSVCRLYSAFGKSLCT